MCRFLAYVGPEIPLRSLLLAPENSLLNQSLDPESHPNLQLAGWGFGAWSSHLLQPDRPLVYRRPKPAFHDDNAAGLLPSLQAATLLAHVRAADYDSSVVQADENCHPYAYEGTRWIMAQNGALPNWRLLQRELLAHCKDDYLAQMRGTTDTEFLYVLLLSLLEGDSDAEVKRGFERLLEVIRAAMEKLGLAALTKLKIALVSRDRIIGANYGCGRAGETDFDADWKALRDTDLDLSMLLEPIYVLTGANFEDYASSYEIDPRPPGEATSAILASEPLTEKGSDWEPVAFGEMVVLECRDGQIRKSLHKLQM